jgi:hypothetical protein
MAHQFDEWLARRKDQEMAPENTSTGIEKGLSTGTRVALQLETLIAAWTPMGALVIKLGRKIADTLRHRGEHEEARDLETEIAALDLKLAESRANLAQYAALRDADRAAEAAGPGAVAD